MVKTRYPFGLLVFLFVFFVLVLYVLYHPFGIRRHWVSFFYTLYLHLFSLLLSLSSYRAVASGQGWNTCLFLHGAPEWILGLFYYYCCCCKVGTRQT